MRCLSPRARRSGRSRDAAVQKQLEVRRVWEARVWREHYILNGAWSICGCSAPWSGQFPAARASYSCAKGARRAI